LSSKFISIEPAHLKRGKLENKKSTG